MMAYDFPAGMKEFRDTILISAGNKYGIPRSAGKSRQSVNRPDAGNRQFGKSETMANVRRIFPAPSVGAYRWKTEIPLRRYPHHLVPVHTRHAEPHPPVRLGKRQPLPLRLQRHLPHPSIHPHGYRDVEDRVHVLHDVESLAPPLRHVMQQMHDPAIL